MKTLTELNLSGKEAEKFVQDYECGECGGRLTIAYGGAFRIREYIIRCGNYVWHEGFGKIKSDRQIIEETPALAEAYSLNMNKSEKEIKSMEKEYGQGAGQKLAKYQGALTLTKDEAIEIIKILWPKAPVDEAKKAAIICHQYGLNPLMKHLFLIPFGEGEKKTWAIVMSIKSTRILASRNKRSYSYKDGPRIMTTDEQISTFGEVDKTKLYVKVILNDNKGSEAPGYGNWPLATLPYGTDKGNTKFNMASIRAERQAFDRLFPDQLPPGIEVVDEAYMNGASIKVINPEKSEPEIQPEELPFEQATKAPSAAQASPNTTTGPEQAQAGTGKAETRKRKMFYGSDWTPQTVGELFQYGLDEKNLAKDMLMTEILSIGNIKDMPPLQEAFAKVKAAKEFK